jgi:glycosyltransferase involved in cell wall biosynthesis
MREHPERATADAERGVPPGERAIRLGRKAPKLSVVVASFRQRALLDQCLASLMPQCAEHGAEIVVARCCPRGEFEELEKAYPSVLFVPAPDGSGVPYLRSQGLAAAEGDVVALTEDHCVVASDWLAQLAVAEQAGADVVGGAMDNARRSRAVDWAAYFAEYGFFAQSGNQPGAAPLLTGANVAYSRRVVGDVVAWARQGEWENVAHSRLLARGSTMQFLRTAAVYQNQSYRFWDFCRDRYEHGRDYARRRLVGAPAARRWVYGTGSAILPFLLVSRVARAVAPANRRAFIRALPITFAFLTAWSVGEAVGYLLGPAADASTAAASGS